MARHELPVPPHSNPEKVGEVWKVPYQERAEDAERGIIDGKTRTSCSTPLESRKSG